MNLDGKVSSQQGDGGGYRLKFVHSWFRYFPLVYDISVLRFSSLHPCHGCCFAIISPFGCEHAGRGREPVFTEITVTTVTN